MAKNPEIPVIKANTNIKNIRKKEARKKLKEKRREEAFVKRYVELMYPTLYGEIKETYAKFVKKYPSRCDITKTYYFKKWEKSVVPNQSNIFVPHLPILTNLEQIRNSLSSQDNKLQDPPLQENREENPPASQDNNLQDPLLQENREENLPASQDNNLQDPLLQENREENPLASQESNSETPPQLSPQPWQDINVQPLDLPVMTLEQMSIAAEEIVKSLQSDKDLMDIVEGLDLPQAVWDNELSIPDYVLENELNW